MSAEVRVEHFRRAYERWDGFSESMLRAISMSYVLKPEEKQEISNRAIPLYHWARGLTVSYGAAMREAYEESVR